MLGLNILSILIVLPLVLLETINFNFEFFTQDYINCTFNILEGSTKKTRRKDLDIIEQITLQNQETGRAWTINWFSKKFGKLEYIPLIRPGEICSVNFITHPTYFDTHLFLYPRIFTPGNLQINILKKSGFKLFLAGAYDVVPVATCPVIVYTYNKNFMLSPLVLLRFITATIPLVSHPLDLDRISNEAGNLYRNPHMSYVEIVQPTWMSDEFIFWRRCKGAYRIKKEPTYVKCSIPHMLAENLGRGDRFNFTPGYTYTISYRKDGSSIQPHQCTVLPRRNCTGRIDYTDYSIVDRGGQNSLIVQFVDQDRKRQFLYCMREGRRESFYLEFWTSPFDLATWVMLLVVPILLASGCVLLLEYLKKHQIAVMLNVFIAFGSMLLCWHYECIISSNLTVQPQILQIQSLRELIERNYKVIGFVGRGNPTTESLVNIFRQHGLEDRVNTTVIPNARRTKAVGNLFQRTVDLIAFCNNTVMRDSYGGLQIMTSLYLRYESLFCYMLPKPWMSHEKIWTISGIIKQEIINDIQQMFSTGIFAHFRNVGDMDNELQHRFYIIWKDRQRRMQDLPIAFKVTDWKVMSVLIGLVILLSCCCMSFVLEKLI